MGEGHIRSLAAWRGESSAVGVGENGGPWNVGDIKPLPWVDWRVLGKMGVHTELLKWRGEWGTPVWEERGHTQPCAGEGRE